MTWIKVIILCVLFGLATCDLECFQKALDNCHKTDEGKIKDASFCGLQPALTGCVSVAAIECKESFEDAAKKANDALIDFCTEGKPLYEAIKNDGNCDMNTFANPECDPKDYKRDANPFKRFSDDDDPHCKNLGSNRDCMFEKFKACSSEAAQKAFETLYDSLLGIMKGMCTLRKP